MVMTQRERYIAIGTAGLIALLVVFYGLIKPYFDRRSEIAADIQTRLVEKQKADTIFAEQAKLRKEFNQMIADGLKTSQAEARGQIRDALSQWGSASGISEKTLNDGQVIHDPDYDQIGFKLSGWGPMATVAKLVNQCETTTLPLRVTKLMINPVKEGQDYLYFELSVSTISRSEKEKTPRLRTSAAGMEFTGGRL